MTIENDAELKKAAAESSRLLQDIHDYCASKNKTIACVPEAKVRFPRGYIRTASEQRKRFPFLDNRNLKSNIAYTLILSDAVIWLAIRTDITGTASQMIYKLFIFLVATVVESTTKEYLKGVCGKGFTKRNEYLVQSKVINQELCDELDWLWKTRNKMHLFQLDDREWKNDYGNENHRRAIKAFRELLSSLKSCGKLSAE